MTDLTEKRIMREVCEEWDLDHTDPRARDVVRRSFRYQAGVLGARQRALGRSIVDALPRPLRRLFR